MTTTGSILARLSDLEDRFSRIEDLATVASVLQSEDLAATAGEKQRHASQRTVYALETEIESFRRDLSATIEQARNASGA